MAAPTRTRRRDKNTKRSDALFGYLIPLVVIGLSIGQFIRTGQIDKYLIGALLIFGLGSLGYRVDTIIEKYLEAKARAGSERDE